MTYCQDCGALNEDGRVDCRVCGRVLERERGTATCAECGQLLDEGAAFCSACGAPVPVAVGVATAAPPADSVVAVLDPAPLPDPAPESEVDGLAAGLDVPDWITRAAAATPPTKVANGHPPADEPTSGRIEAAAEHDEAASGGDRLVVEQPIDTLAAENILVAEKEPAADRALPPLPDGGLAAAMPDWLREAPEPTDAAAVEPTSLMPPAIATGVVVPPVALAAAPTAELADPTSFIGENDLPAWIRNLAAKEAAEAEAARQVEAEAQAQTRVQAVEQAATLPERRGRSTAEPFEPAESRTATSAPTWLVRREHAVAGDGFADAANERTAVFTEAMETRAAAPGIDRLRPRPEAAPADEPAEPAPELVVVPPAVVTPKRAARENRRLRLVLMALLVVALAAAAYLYASGML